MGGAGVGVGHGAVLALLLLLVQLLLRRTLHTYRHGARWKAAHCSHGGVLLTLVFVLLAHAASSGWPGKIKTNLKW